MWCSACVAHEIDEARHSHLHTVIAPSTLQFSLPFGVLGFKSYLLLIKLPANASWEAGHSDSSMWVPNNHIGNPDAILVQA